MNSADDSGGPRGAARKAKGFRRIEHDSMGEVRVPVNAM